MNNYPYMWVALMSLSVGILIGAGFVLYMLGLSGNKEGDIFDEGYFQGYSEGYNDAFKNDKIKISKEDGYGKDDKLTPADIV